MSIRAITTPIFLATVGLAAMAQGFSQQGQGTAGLGNAGAYVSRAEDPSAVYYNPAGLVNVKGTQLALSAHNALSKSFYNNTAQNQFGSEGSWEVSPTFYANYTKKRWALGYGISTTYQYDLNWDEADTPTRFTSTGSTFDVQEYMGAVSFRLTDKFSVGATVRFANAGYERHNTVVRPFGDTASDNRLYYETRRNLDVSGEDIGFTLGFQYFRSSRFNVGLIYQSPIEIEMDGDLSYQQLTQLGDPRAQADFSARFSSGHPLATTIELPERIQIGVATKITVRTRLEIDLAQENWSSWEQTVFSGGPQPIVYDHQWDDVFSVRVAGDFQQRRALLWRVGLASYESAVPQTTLNASFPDNHRFEYSFGVSFNRGKWDMEFGYRYIQNKDRDTQALEYQIVNEGPDYIAPTGEDGRFETQRNQLQLGVKRRF